MSSADTPGRGARGASGLRRRLGQAAFLVFVPLLLLELAVRVAGPLVPAGEALLYSPTVASTYDQARTLPELLESSALGFRPGTRYNDFVLNSRSFLTKEYDEQKPEGTLRVLAFGNSFTIDCGGLPYDRLWHYRLREHLEGRTGQRVEILNLGVPAVGPEFQLRLWELEGSRLDADMVVVGFTAGTNFLASRRAQRERGFADRCGDWSQAFRLVRNALRLRSAMPAGGWRNNGGPRRDERIPEDARGVPLAEVVPYYQQDYDPDRPAFSEEKFMVIQRGYVKSCGTHFQDERFGPAARTLTKLRDAVVAGGAEFLVVVFPFEAQSNEVLLAEVLASSSKLTAGPELDLEAPQKYLRAHCEREGIRYLDLLPAFRVADPETPRYGKYDTHWNLAGNDLAERELYDYLMRPAEDGGPSLWDVLIANSGNEPR